MQLSPGNSYISFFVLLKVFDVNSSNETRTFSKTEIIEAPRKNETNDLVPSENKASDSIHTNRGHYQIKTEMVNSNCGWKLLFEFLFELSKSEFAHISVCNVTLSSTFYETENEKNILICLKACEVTRCGTDEFEILQSRRFANETLHWMMCNRNGTRTENSVLQSYEDGQLNATRKPKNISKETVLVYVGHVLTGISVIALSLHLIVFCLVLDNRNLPGYNLASLSLSLLLGYSFFLIGQIPEVLGTPCILSGLLQQYFFLASFFWMNIMAFDVWRALQLATTKLHVSSKKIKVRKFLLYSACAWVFPLALVITSVVADNVDAFPHEYKPFFGRSDYCWFTNGKALLAFFAGPIFSLIGVNSIFFAMTAYIIVHNSIKEQRDQHVTAARRNFMLYVRLGLIMGVTWLIGIVGNLTNNNEVWFVFTVLNTTQGLFIFVFFTCAPNAKKTFKRKTRYKVSKRPPRNPQVRHVSEIDEKFRMTTPKTVCCI